MSITSTAKFTRHDLEEYLRSQGAIIQKQVNSKTDLVLALDQPSQPKIEKATQLSVPIYYLEDYLENR